MANEQQAEPKIIGCRIEHGMSFGAVDKVIVDLDDGRKDRQIFTYFPDELQFTASEFIGLTPKQAEELRHQKDVAYLQS